jgi:hypothetical protein
MSKMENKEKQPNLASLREKMNRLVRQFSILNAAGQNLGDELGAIMQELGMMPAGMIGPVVESSPDEKKTGESIREKPVPPLK